jgi:predicted Ser/Thr protein kinase
VSDSIRECRQFVLSALAAKMERRSHDPDWVDNERLTVVIAANNWAETHGYDRTITVADIERIESNAVGHVDYATKLALYVAEFIIDPQPWQVAR